LRATRAYITSFGTTGLLITSALATLFVMSAFVAFNGFPGQDVQDPIAPILVHETQAPVSVPAEPARGAVLDARTGGSSASRTGSSAARRHGGPRAHTGPVSGPRTTAPVQGPSGGGQTPLQTPQTGGDVTSPAGGVTQQLPSGTPSVPSAQLPSVNVPEVQIPSLPQGDSQLPVDTSGVTKLLGG
jgi:hypothetical protein